MIRLKDVEGDGIEVSILSGDEIMVDDLRSGLFSTFTPTQARELASALIECANKIQRKGGE